MKDAYIYYNPKKERKVKTMNYLVIMGRGIEGTGNTKYALEFKKYVKSTGCTCDIIANSDKKWGREESHPGAKDIEHIPFTFNVSTIVNRAVNYDYVFIFSVPAKNYPYESCSAFREIVKLLHMHGKRLVYFQLDHRIHSINRNFYADILFEDFFQYIDLVVTHYHNIDFERFCDRNLITIKNMMTAAELGLSSINIFNFDEYKPYWKSHEEKLDKSLRFLGRCAPWKGLWKVRDIHRDYLQKEGYITIIEGVEQSIQSVQELLKELHPRTARDDVSLRLDKQYWKSIDNETLLLERNKPAYMLPPYSNKNALERMSKTMFGIELLMLDDEYLNYNCEYAMMEMIAVGTIPVFRKRWGEKFLVDGKPIIEQCDGIIYMDENHPEEAIELMNKLNDNAEMYEEMRTKCFNFFKQHFNCDKSFDKILEAVNAL